MLDKLVRLGLEYGQLAYDYFSSPVVLTQLGLIVVLIPPALLLAQRITPVWEQKARKIKYMPGLLRVVVAIRRRSRWVFFVILQAIAYFLTSVFAWPESNYLTYVALLLSAAWLLITVTSHALRSRFLRRVFALSAWIYVTAAILGVVDDTAQFLHDVGFNVGDNRMSLLGALQAAFLIAAAMWVSVTLGNFLDRRIQTSEELTPSLRVLIGKITRISLIFVAALVTISGLGLDLSALTVLSGAVGVGIGFGLQKVVSNFISGIIILLDQSIKPGDTISLNETFGWIRELRARFVSVVTRDGREFLIPNEDFITNEVINWSFSDQYVRLDVDFGVSYDADPHEVTRVAIAAAGSVGRVEAAKRPPVCWMTEFGDSSIDFKLRFWITDPQQGLTNIRGKVLLALWDAFKENGIGIPYPHRELIVKTPVAITSAGD